MYALVKGGALVQVGSLPRLWWSGTEWLDLTQPGVDLAALGWTEVVSVPRPSNTDTSTTDYAVDLVAGVPTVVWTSRDWTPEELTDRTEEANRAVLLAGLDEEITKALSRQAEAQTIRDTLNATIRDNPVPYIQTLAKITKRQERAIIRLVRLVGNLTTSADTGTE